jgi:tRNA pseudouridine55 synthase
VLLIGRATRLSRYVTGLDKSYIATARFGAVSDTLDADGNIRPLEDAPMPRAATIRAATEHFTGQILQTPPMASAVRVGGVRLYKALRRGETVAREPRPATVHSLSLSGLDPGTRTATFEISCGSGTYVRTLVSDLAEFLGTGAYLTALRRTHVGHLDIRDTESPGDLESETLFTRIIHVEEVLSHLPKVEVSGEEWPTVCNGGRLAAFGVRGSYRVEARGVLLAVYRDEGEVARAEVVLCMG